jgi:hypothetical protein
MFNLIEKSLLKMTVVVQGYLGLYLLYCFIIAPRKPLDDIWWLIAFLTLFYSIFVGTIFVVYYLITSKSEKAVIYIILQPFISISVCIIQFLLIHL